MSNEKSCTDCYKFDMLCYGTKDLKTTATCFEPKLKTPRPENSSGSAELALLNACRSLKTAYDQLNTGRQIRSTGEMVRRVGAERNAIKAVIDALGKVGI